MRRPSRRGAGAAVAPYLVAIALVAMAMILRGPALGRFLGGDAPLSIFVAAVALAAWYGGLKPGLLATILSIVVGTYLFIEHDTLVPRKLADRVRAVLFIGEGAMISWLFDEIRSARLRAEEQHRQLVEEIKLRQAVEEELRAANERKDVFVAAVAHELRNPLGPIHNALEIIQVAGDDPAMVERAHGMIGRQVEQMQRLINDLMDVSRIGQGKLQLQRQRIELASVVQMALESCASQVAAAGHELTVALPPEPILLDADPTRMVQILCNLLTNAAKYTEPKGHISLSAERDEKNVVIRVRDDGIGIPPESLPSIFEMFVQVEEGAKQRQGGLGIGLALVRRLVRLHGGTVEAHSAGRGQGSEFIVRLPQAGRGLEALRS